MEKLRNKLLQTCYDTAKLLQNKTNTLQPLRLREKKKCTISLSLSTMMKEEYSNIAYQAYIRNLEMFSEGLKYSSLKTKSTLTAVEEKKKIICRLDRKKLIALCDRRRRFLIWSYDEEKALIEFVIHMYKSVGNVKWEEVRFVPELQERAFQSHVYYTCRSKFLRLIKSCRSMNYIAIAKFAAKYNLLESDAIFMIRRHNQLSSEWKQISGRQDKVTMSNTASNDDLVKDEKNYVSLTTVPDSLLAMQKLDLSDGSQGEDTVNPYPQLHTSQNKAVGKSDSVRLKENDQDHAPLGISAVNPQCRKTEKLGQSHPHSSSVKEADIDPYLLEKYSTFKCMAAFLNKSHFNLQ